MHLHKLLIVSIVLLIESTQTLSQEVSPFFLQKDSSSSVAPPLFKIKRMRTKNYKVTSNFKPQKSLKEEHLLSLQKERVKLQDDRDKLEKPSKTKVLKNLPKNSHTLNKKLLNKMGFTKVKAPNSHNRKRLAVESRRHASADDSHMFIIKLPPNLHYYASPKEAAMVSNTKNSLLPQQFVSPPSSLNLEAATDKHFHPEAEVMNANGKKVSFPFNSNGKPSKVYHWNLPIIKKILEDKERFPHLVSKAVEDQLIDIKNTPTWSKPWENEAHGKSSMMSHYKKSMKRKSPSYYAPATSVNKNSFNKYFSGNGKPRGFYVIKENQKKPLYYKNIVS